MPAPYRACASRGRKASVHRFATSLLPAGPPTPFKHRLEHVSGQARIFPQTADGVCVPVTSKRNIDAQVVAGRPDDIAELLIDTKQHLELVSSRGKFQVANDSKCLPYHQFVMRRNADI